MRPNVNTQIPPEDERKANSALRQHFQVEETVNTPDAAAMIGKRPQTLRRWACQGSGPIQPVRINGRLHWKVRELRALAAGETVAA
jgi:hypothetical protein